MKMIEIVIPVFRDKERFSQITEVTRKGKKINLIGKLFFKNDKYYVSQERAKELEEKGIVRIIKEEKQNVTKKTNIESGE